MNQQNNSRFKMKFLQKGEEGAERPSLHIYGDIYQTFDDWLSGEEGNTAKGIQQFLEANKGVDGIDVYINSMGGDVFEGTAIANQLRRFDGNVTVTVDGFACSIASVIAMAGDEVRMPRNATMMIHNMWTGICGNASELRKMADDLDVLMEANKTIYLDKAGDKLDYDKLTEMLDAETWLTAEQCVEYGLADTVLDYSVDRDQRISEAGGAVAAQRADALIERLQQAHDTLAEMVQFVDDEEPEVDLGEFEPIELKQTGAQKPRNFLDIFS